MDHEKLKTLISGILQEMNDDIPKVKLAKLVLFTEIEYFKSHGRSYTGLYFVRLGMGPVIAFFDDVLMQYSSNLWEKKTAYIPIYEEGKKKAQHSYSLRYKIDIPEELMNVLQKVLKIYGHKTGTELSFLSHNLPAWKYSEPNEPIYIAELAAEEDKDYFALTDLIESLDEDNDASLPEELSQSLFAAEAKV